MILLLCGQGEYFWQLVEKLSSEFDKMQIYIVTTDPENKLSYLSDKTIVLSYNFSNTAVSWFDLANVIPDDEIALVSFQFPFKVPQSITNSMQRGAWNLHTAPLPEFGGWNGSAHAIIEDFKYFGPTLHEMTDVIDGGSCIDTDYFELTGSETSYEILIESKLRGLQLVYNLVDNLLAGLKPPKIVLRPGDLRFFNKNEIEKFRIVKINEGAHRISQIARAFSHPDFPSAKLDLGNGQLISMRIDSPK
jgi:methionyl-tRNA formyltransferase